MIVTYDALCVRDNSVDKKCSGQRDTRISRYVYTFIRIYVYIHIYISRYKSRSYFYKIND